ncbi:MAG: 16S rRNA (uracil(1498)-N(3))-methyltransferase [Proteobacteria bacterium]|nr:16S rRNA (uracil(1498)-N(3))-methyltransferase [Pseudomonadota bacterium]
MQKQKKLHRFFCPNINGATNLIFLSPKASHHAQNVLRLKENSELIIFDGLGNQFKACIESLGKKLVEIRLITTIDKNRESPLNITIGQALTRMDKMDFTIQKTVELGVSKIIPLFTQKSNIKLSDNKFNKKMEHWHNLACAACEQCGRSVVPSISKPINIKEWLNNLDNSNTSEKVRLILDPTAKKTISSLPISQKNIILLVGPESGFTETEIAIAIDKGFFPANLGPRILRAETAGIAAMSIIQSVWGDL